MQEVIPVWISNIHTQAYVQTHTQIHPHSWVLVLTPVILATWEAELGGSQFKASPGK
jgi:hypothetical protein